MTIQRLENVGIVVDDLEAVKAFFVDLGLKVLGEGPAKGDWVDRVVGLKGVHQDIVMLETLDGHGRLELMKIHEPPVRDAPPNTLGIRRIAFAVDDIGAAVAGLQARGVEVVGEVVNYEDIYPALLRPRPRGDHRHVGGAAGLDEDPEDQHEHQPADRQDRLHQRPGLDGLADGEAEVLAGRTHHGPMPAKPNPKAIDLHDTVARAVRHGDPATAETAMREIIDVAAAAMRAEFGG